MKVIALEWNTTMLIDILVELSTRYDWQLIYCVSSGTQNYLKERFPFAIYHDTHDARYDRPPAELADMPRAIVDQPMAEALSFAEVMAVKQMDRMEIMGRFATHDRFIHFHRLVGYWSALLDRLRPDVLLMPTSPHVTYDYIAYVLARRRGIPIIMFEFVGSDGLLMAINGFEDGLPPLQAAYRRLRGEPPPAQIVLSERMEAYWRSLHGSFEQATPHWLRLTQSWNEEFKVAKEQADAQARRLADEELKSLADQQTKQAAKKEERKLAEREANRWPNRFRLALRLLRGAVPASQLLPRLSHSSSELGFGDPVEPAVAIPATFATPPSTDGHYDGRFFKAAETPQSVAREAAEFRARHIDSLNRKYDALATLPDLDQPYVYVALHLQPERATNPNGGVFDDQDVMIGLIASVLPTGWRIYAKEHPVQFMPVFASERGRWETFYDAVLSHPAVSLVPSRLSSFELIDHARAVASVTGTSCWEAIARGVPALVFGEAWYKGCDGAHTVRTIDDCQQALAKIAAGDRPNAEAVRLFLLAAEETAIRGYLSSDDQAIAGVAEATNVSSLAGAIAECYRASVAGHSMRLVAGSNA